VGILEKIVQSIQQAAANRSSRGFGTGTQSELDMQYRTQIDVLRQLEEKALKQLRLVSSSGSSSSAAATTFAKLTRDFELVRSHSSQLQDRVTKIHQAQAAQLKASGGGGAAGYGGTDHLSDGGLDGTSNDPNAAGAAAQQEYYHQIQLQLQEDVSYSVRGGQCLFTCFLMLTLVFVARFGIISA
jgi:hypothetical protein